MRIHLGVIFGTLVQREVEQHREIMTAYALRFAEDSRGFTPADYVESLEIEARVFAGLAGVFGGFRVLICPTLAVPAFEAGDDYLDHGPTINGRPQPSWYEGLMTYPFNICSRCPVMSVPSGFAAIERADRTADRGPPLRRRQRLSRRGSVRARCTDLARHPGA